MLKVRFYNIITSRPTWIAMCVLALAFRFLKPLHLGYVSGDYLYWVAGWLGKIHDHGFEIYSREFTNYAPAYTYVLGLVSLLPQHLWLSVVKTVSILFDAVTALAAFGITARLLPPGSSRRYAPWLAAAVVLWLPSVWLNSAVWAQCDSLWVAMCMVSLLCFLKRRPAWAMACFGLAVSIKLQAVFFSPVVLLMLLQRRARWWQLLIVPGVYLLLCLPCAVAGRSWESLLGIYVGQYDYYPGWTMNSASICYVLRGFEYNSVVAGIIVLAAGVVTLWATVAVSRLSRDAGDAMSDRIAVMFAAFCAVAVPWMLPMMHERYMILGDVLTAVCAVCFASRRWVWTAVLVELASTVNVVWFLLDFGHRIFDGPTVRFTNVPPLIMATVALYLMIKVYRSLKSELSLPRPAPKSLNDEACR